MALEVGSRAIVRGLRSRPELNGATVVLLECLPLGRWGVRCETDSSCNLSLRPEHLSMVVPLMPDGSTDDLVTVRMWMSPSMLPHSSNEATTQALHNALGIYGVSRNDPRAADAVPPFGPAGGFGGGTSRRNASMAGL